MYRIGDKVFEKYIDRATIEAITDRVALQISKDYKGKETVFVVVLNGAFMFATDVLKKVNLLAKVSFVKLASYQSERSTGVVKRLIGLGEDIKDKDVIIVEDIVDTGLTMKMLREQLLELGPKSLEIASLVFKPGKFHQDFEVKYKGMDIEDPFIIGYGLDLDGYGRNLPEIYQLKQ